MKLPILFIFFISSLATYSQELNKENVYFEIYDAALKAKDKKAEGIRTLYKQSLIDQKDPMLNKLLIKTTVLAMINANSKAIRNYIPAVDSKFIMLEPLNFLGQNPLQVTCFKCKGHGINKFPCKDCFKGVCKNCKGKKQIGYKGLGGEYITKDCITCKATGICLGCDKKGTASKPCHICYEKGTIFSPRAIPTEYAKSLQYLIDFIPKYAAGKDIFITEKMVAVAKQDQLKKELEEARKMAEQKKAEELAALELERKEAKKRREAREERERKKREELAEAFSKPQQPSNSMNDNLQHVLLEFNQFFRNRERIQKQSIYVDAEAKYEKGKPTLIIEVTPSIGGMAKGLKLQYLEAFYNFFKLRCMSNGLGKKVGYIANYKKRQIATSENDQVVLN